MSTAPANETITATDGPTKPPFLRRVRIRGYKSIAFCDVILEPLTVLVGRNASGKSNFLDALAFLRVALETNITEATKRHGGWHSILSRHSSDGQISIEIELSNSVYEFVLREGPYGTPILIHEKFQSTERSDDSNSHFDRNGAYDGSQKHVNYKWSFHHPEIPCSQVPNPRPDRLWLDSFGKPPFIDMADGLRFSGYYNFSPRQMRQLQKPEPGSMLTENGQNIASVIESTREIDEDTISRVGAYLSAVVNEVEKFDIIHYGEYETVRFRLRSSQSNSTLEFDAASMSDGTLRGLAALVAAFQIHVPFRPPTIIGIEEPETSLHPAAMRALVDALDEATARTQIILTTHSAEMLDNPTIRPENVRVVEMIDGQTMIAPVDEASLNIIRRKLNTLGGLERDNLLELDLDDLDRQKQLRQIREESST
jgi:predicted ATPase